MSGLITIRHLTVLSLVCAVLTLPACVRHNRDDSGKPYVYANEAPPAAPFGINVQNQNDDNNLLGYRESMTVHDEGRVTALSLPEVSRRLAEALTTMDGVQTAHVLVSGDRAFVALTIRDANGREGGGISPFLKGTVSDKIRTMEPGIRHVHVTDRADFVKRFETIRKDMQNGRPTDRLLRELSEAVGRMIPTWTVGNNPPPATP